MFKKLILTLTILCCHPLIFADQYVFDSDKQLDSLQSKDILNNKIKVERTFSTFDSFVTKLRALGLPVSVLSTPSIPQSNVNMSFSGTTKDFINQASIKFGYKWSETENQTIEFRAITPLIVKVVPPTKIIYPKTPSLVTNAIPQLASWVLLPSDRTLRNAFSKWCKQANWQLSWKARGDFPITASWTINGTFENAINQVLKSSQQTDMPLQALMFDANRVLEISSPK